MLVVLTRIYCPRSAHHRVMGSTAVSIQSTEAQWYRNEKVKDTGHTRCKNLFCTRSGWLLYFEMARVLLWEFSCKTLSLPRGSGNFVANMSISLQNLVKIDDWLMDLVVFLVCNIDKGFYVNALLIFVKLFPSLELISSQSIIAGPIFRTFTVRIFVPSVLCGSNEFVILNKLRAA